MSNRKYLFILAEDARNSEDFKKILSGYLK